MNTLLRNDSGNLPIFSPAVDIRDRGNDISLRADLPGVRREDVDVVVEQHVLSIVAKSSLAADPKFVPVHEEFKPSHFFRSFILAEEVDTDGIEADFDNGVLTVHLPKRVP